MGDSPRTGIPIAPALALEQAGIEKFVRLIQSSYQPVRVDEKKVFSETIWLQNFAYRAEVSWWMFPTVGMLALITALLTVAYQTVSAALTNLGVLPASRWRSQYHPCPKLFAVARKR